jgi:hypothetical protein
LAYPPLKNKQRRNTGVQTVTEGSLGSLHSRISPQFASLRMTEIVAGTVTLILP